jgi:methylthioribose-1-phosphate isomerase
MKVDGVARRTIWVAADGWTVEIIDQTLLPHEFVIKPLSDLAGAAEAISAMRVRGAPLVGGTAAYGVALQMHHDASDSALDRAVDELAATRPTAINLRWALDEMCAVLKPIPAAQRAQRAYARAAEICDEDVASNRAIGKHGFQVFERIWQEGGGREPLNVLTHCNAGWLATIDWGTALAPVYVAHDRGLPIHVWVDETRPRNQGASLTAWELGNHGVAHTVISDNAGGHLMQHGRVDLCITGSDRTTSTGDVCNKIGTYLKALSARDNGLPFYVALPHSTIDWSLRDGVAEIPIEERDGREVSHLRGAAADGQSVEIAILPESSPVANPAFDVTPARLVSALITERGVCEASEAGLLDLYPERGSEPSKP